MTVRQATVQHLPTKKEKQNKIEKKNKRRNCFVSRKTYYILYAPNTRTAKIRKKRKQRDLRGEVERRKNNARTKQ